MNKEVIIDIENPKDNDLISRQAVLDKMKERDEGLSCICPKDIMGLPPVTPKPCEDCISRQAVLEQINCWIGSGEYKYTNATYYLTKRMQDLPPVSPKTKNGRWARELIRNEKGGCIGAKMICSECGQDNGYDKRMKFCPNCGCKMQEVE